MADERTGEGSQQSQAKPKKKSKGPLLAIVGVVLLAVLLGGGYLGYRAMQKEGEGNGKDPKEQNGGLEKPSAGKYVEILSPSADTFSLKDNSFIKFQMSVEISKEDQETETIINQRRVQIKDALIYMFNEATADELKEASGKERFKEGLRKRLGEFLDLKKVRGIYFDSFLIQG